MSFPNHRGRIGLIGGSLPRNNLSQLFSILKGGAGSGNMGHTGRKGKRGGSASKGSGTQVTDAQGNPLVLYHGSSKDFETFSRPTYNHTEQLGFGFHFAENSDFANLYAKKGGKVKSVILNVKNLLDADSIVLEGTKEFELGKKLAGKNFRPQNMYNDDGTLTGKKGVYLQSLIDSTSPKRAEKIIQDMGFDGIKYLARYGSRTLGGMKVDSETTAYVVFNPEQIVIL